MAKKLIKLKICVVCEREYKPFKTTSRVCSTQCAIKFAKEKVILKQKREAAQLDVLRNELYGVEKIGKLIHSTTTIVHGYIRKRDKGKPCVSCGTPWRPNFQAGHYFSKNKYNALRFNFMNIHGQCPKCNTFKEGNFDGYSLRLPDRIGRENFDILHILAHDAAAYPYTFTREELKAIQTEAIRLRKKHGNNGYFYLDI